MGESEDASAGRSSPPTVLAPGFRFHPTDEELVWYYLRRKVSGKRFRVDAISEIDIYKVEPADLPGLSKLKSKDREWYFFSALDRKYGNGMRTNRATEKGYWKTTGKDRPVHHNGRLVGMKKTLVYHFGRAPHGKRTDWVMHEYKLIDKILEDAGYPLEGYVLCRIFQKSGSGPKNGENYGAKFVDEEWEDNGALNAVAGEVSFEDPYGDDDSPGPSANADALIEKNDFAQALQNIPVPDNFSSQGSQTRVGDCGDVTGTDQKPSVGDYEYVSSLQALDNQMICDLIQDGSSANVVKNEYIAAPSNECDQVLFSLDELLSNDVIGAPLDDGQYFDAADFWDPAQFGSILDDDVDIAAHLNFDFRSQQIDANSDLGFPTNQNLDVVFSQAPPACELLPGSCDNTTGSSSNQVMDDPIDKPSKTALNVASSWLESIPAHPAYASEMPTKGVMAQLTAAVQSSSPPHVTAGMIRIRDMPMAIGARGSGLQWSFDKTGNMTILLSFDVPQPVETFSGLSSSKFAAAVSRGWMYFMFFWLFVFAITMKAGTCIYAK